MVSLPLDSLVYRADAGPRCLVLLHGYGEPASDLTDRLHLLDPGRRFVVVVPTAPIQWRGRRIWHRPLTSPDEAATQYVSSVSALDDLVGAIDDELGIPPADTVVGGFSQGGGLAIGLLIGADVEHRPAAGFGVCSFPPVVPGFRVDQVAATGRRYFLSSARDDHFASIDISRQGARALRAVGLDLTYVEADGGHEMTDVAATRIGQWLAGAAGRPEGEPPDLLGDSDAPTMYDGMWEVVSR